MNAFAIRSISNRAYIHKKVHPKVSTSVVDRRFTVTQRLGADSGHFTEFDDLKKKLLKFGKVFGTQDLGAVAPLVPKGTFLQNISTLLRYTKIRQKRIIQQA